MVIARALAQSNLMNTNIYVTRDYFALLAMTCLLTFYKCIIMSSEKKQDYPDTKMCVDACYKVIHNNA